MNIFIDKNILLDEIIKENEFIVSYPDTKQTTHFVEIIMDLRNSIDIVQDLYNCEIICNIIDNIIYDTEEYIKIINVDETKDIEFLYQIIYNLNNTKIKINHFKTRLNDIDYITDILNNIII